VGAQRPEGNSRERFLPWEALSLAAGAQGNGLLDILAYEGHTDTEGFLWLLKEGVLPKMNRFPAPNTASQVICRTDITKRLTCRAGRSKSHQSTVNIVVGPPRYSTGLQLRGSSKLGRLHRHLVSLSRPLSPALFDSRNLEP
jgi:hypothetical protein